MDFEWDPIKSERNRRERGFGFELAVRIFAGPIIEWIDDRFDYGEVRVVAVGRAAQS